MAKGAEREESETPAPAAPVVLHETVFVNREKLERAKGILELVSGKRVPRTDGEAEQKERFAAIFADNDQDPKHKDALRFVYETLGGLVRTESEQKDADEAAATARERFSRNKLGEKTEN